MIKIEKGKRYLNNKGTIGKPMEFSVYIGGYQDGTGLYTDNGESYYDDWSIVAECVFYLDLKIFNWKLVILKNN